jgi:uncharacterized membrane protein YhaH (DUF805 family)
MSSFSPSRDPVLPSTNLPRLAFLTWSEPGYNQTELPIIHNPLKTMNELFSTDGRIPRSTFWKLILIFYGIGAVLGFIGEKSGSNLVRGVLGLLMLPLFVMGIFVQIKRWHDRDKSGWWIFIALIPCVGPIWALIETGFLKGTTGPNRFGADPVP